MSMDGLGDYSRNSGYTKGDVNLTYETVTFNYDRGRKFFVDSMDNEETAGIAFGKLSSEFTRTKAVPEEDAFRLATYAGTEGISKATPATLSTGTDVIGALRAATNKMDEDEVSLENRILYITPTLYGMIQDLDTTKSKEVLSRFSKVVQVPQTRFFTAIDLYDGSADGETAGGYVKHKANSEKSGDVDGKEINFLVIQKDAILQYPKHLVHKVITPEANQESDGWAFFYRTYGLADVYENKVAGIYLHHKA